MLSKEDIRPFKKGTLKTFYFNISKTVHTEINMLHIVRTLKESVLKILNFQSKVPYTCLGNILYFKTLRVILLLLFSGLNLQALLLYYKRNARGPSISNPTKSTVHNSSFEA